MWWSVFLKAACLASCGAAHRLVLRQARRVVRNGTQQQESIKNNTCQWLGNQLEIKRPCRNLQVWGDGGFLHFAKFNGVGTVGNLQILGSRHKGVVYASHAWSCHTIHDIVSVSEDGTSLALTYVYSDPKTQIVNYAYVESTSMGRIEGVRAHGKVKPSNKCGANFAPNSLPVWKGHTKPRQLGLKINGPELHLSPNGRGRALMSRQNLKQNFGVTVFSVVDCTDCPAQQHRGRAYDLHSSGWLELHILLQSQTYRNDACFGIIYLYHENPSLVEVHFGVCWPKLDTLPSRSFRSKWEPSGQGPLLGFGNVSRGIMMPLMT